MRYAITLLLVVVGLTVGGTMLSRYPGYVKLGFSAGEIEMPLWYFIVALLFIIICSVVVFKLVWTIIRLPVIAKRFGKNRKVIKASDLLQKGMLAMGKGQWKRAEKILVQGARVSHRSNRDPSVFLTAAAEAAQSLGAKSRRDQYLLEARQLAAEGLDTLNAALTEAKLYLDDGEPAQALAVLKPHHQSHYNNPQLQGIELQSLMQLSDYGKAWEILKSMKKSLPGKTFFQERQASLAKSLFDSPHNHIETVEKVWAELPKISQHNEGIMLSYISALIHHDKTEQAEQLLAKSISKDYSDPLIHAYIQLEVGSSATRLKKVQRWLRSQPDNVYLNYGAANLAYQSEKFAEAKAFAEKSLKEQALPETFALLGKIYEALGEENHALQAYKGTAALLYNDSSKTVEGELVSREKTANAHIEKDQSKLAVDSTETPQEKT